MKDYVDIYSSKLADIVKSSTFETGFPDSLKFADISPLYKRDSRSSKENYRPVSKLPALSKVFQNYMYDQINDFMSERFSPLLSGFRKGYSSQHALLHMLDHWHSKLDSGQYVAAVVMDLSKAFDSINHSL